VPFDTVDLPGGVRARGPPGEASADPLSSSPTSGSRRGSGAADEIGLSEKASGPRSWLKDPLEDADEVDELAET